MHMHMHMHKAFSLFALHAYLSIRSLFFSS
jgi:hypothetical protein